MIETPSNQSTLLGRAGNLSNAIRELEKLAEQQRIALFGPRPAAEGTPPSAQTLAQYLDDAICRVTALCKDLNQTNQNIGARPLDPQATVTGYAVNQ
jgi:hypothetical protein